MDVNANEQAPTLAGEGGIACPGIFEWVIISDRLVGNDNRFVVTGVAERQITAESDLHFKNAISYSFSPVYFLSAKSFLLSSSRVPAEQFSLL